MPAMPTAHPSRNSAGTMDYRVEFPLVESIPEKIEETTQEKIAALLKLTPMITRRRLAEQIGISDNGRQISSE